MEISTQLLILGVLVFFSAIFSGVETAVISVNRMRIKHLKDKKIKNADILEYLKDNSHNTISSLLIGNNLLNIAASALATSIAIDRWGNNGIGIATGIMTFIILVFAEISPKTIATNHSEKIALFFSRPLRVLITILKPIRVILDIFTKIITKAFGAQKRKNTVTEEEIKSFVNIGEQEGEIKPIEKVMINNIFKFNDIEVVDAMVARKDTLVFEANMKIQQVLKKIIKSGYSRFPIYEDEKDDIVGVAYLKDIVKEIDNKRNPTLKKIAKKPFFVPESKKIDTLLREFQSRKVHMAIVVDETGVFTGLITIEDLIEEIVGDIYDEQDKIINNIKQISKNEFEVLGDTDIKDINKKLKYKINYDPYETISAYLLEKMGKIPKVNDMYKLKKIHFKITSMDNNRIMKVLINLK